MAGDGRLHVEQRLPGDGRDAAAPGRGRRRHRRCGTPRVARLPAAGVAVVLALFPSTRSWGLLPAVAFAVLTGMAFAAADHGVVVDAGASDQSFPAIMRFAIVPMFLFAGAFYPIDQLPGLAAARRLAPRRCATASSCAAAPCSARSASPSRGPRRRAAAFWLAGYLVCQARSPEARR